jgi:hypothetical protein
MSQVEMLYAARREYHEDQIQTSIIKILEPGNEFLKDVVDQFCKTRMLSNKPHVACFFELKASNVGRIVGKQDRTVSSITSYIPHILTICAEICGERKLWLPRPF